MPRLRQPSYEQKRKLRKRKTRSSSNYVTEEEERLAELQELRDNAQMYLSPFKPDWTETKDNADGSQDQSGENIHVKEERDSPLGEDPLGQEFDAGNEGAAVAGEATDRVKQTEGSAESKTADLDKPKEEPSPEIKKETDVDGDVKNQDDLLPPPAVKLQSGEIDEENFVVDCDPMIVANPGVSAEPSKALSSDADDSSFSSSSNQFFTDVLKNNEIFYNQMSNSASTFDDAELARVLQDYYDKIMTVSDETFEKRKRAAAIQRRRRKKMLDKMNEDQVKEYRAKQTAACRMRRHRRWERLSEEEKKRDRMLKNALCLARRHRREAMMSEEERNARKAAAAAAQREKRKKKRENMTDEELKAHKAEVAAIWRMRRHLRYMKMSEEERKAERAKAAEAKRISRQRQKDPNDQDPYFRPPTPTDKPRRKRGRPRLYKRKDEEEEEEQQQQQQNAGGGDGVDEVTAESLITQILKQTQHIAALESQDGDAGVGAPEAEPPQNESSSYNNEPYLLPHERGEATPPKMTGETYLLPHEIPEKESNKDPNQLNEAKAKDQKSYLLPHERPESHYDARNPPGTTQEDRPGSCPYPEENLEHQDPHANQRSNTAQETHHEAEDQHPDAMQEIKQEACALTNKGTEQHLNLYSNPNLRQDNEEYSQSHVPENRAHLGMPPIYHQPGLGEGNHPRQYYPSEPLDATKHIQHRIHAGEHLLPPPPPPQYHPSAIPYDSRAAALHQYHLSNLPGMNHPGHFPPYHHPPYHSESQDNQSSALQQYIHSRNYMNTLY